MDLDFGSFVKKMCGERQLFRAYYYNILQDPDRRGAAYQEQQKFLATLYNTPYLEVCLGISKYRGDVLIEKGVDIMMATDVLQFAYRDLYDVALLVSGDADFAYAMQAVKNLGKHVEVVAFPSNLSYELTQTADVLHVLDRDFFDDLWSNSREEKGGSKPQRRRRRRTPAKKKGEGD